MLLPFIIGTAANYYMDLGWFGHYGKLAVSVAILVTCILIAVGRGQTPQSDT